jgi:integrase
VLSRAQRWPCRDIRTLWSFADKNKWAEAETPKNTETARDSARLLTASSDDELLAYHAIGLFAGLRMPEIVKLDWQDVNFEKGFIDVGILKAKTRMRRHAPLTDNLRAWLQPIAKPVGKIISGGLRKRHEAAREKAGIQWQANILRHSFVSYRLADTQDSAKVALESGHDQTCCSNIICTSSQKKMQSGISTSGRC